jgi:hypothetical protein
MHRRSIFLLLVLVALASPSAWARDHDDRERTARTSCLSGDYVKGVAILSELFVDTRNPTHIYNQGRCFEQNRRYDDAIARFQEYLRVGRDLGQEEKREAAKHIDDCQALLDRQVGRTDSRTSAATTMPDERSPFVGGLAEATSTSQPPVAAPGQAAAATGVGQAVAVRAPGEPGGALRATGLVLGLSGVAFIGAGVAFSLKANGMASDIEKPDGYSANKVSTQGTYHDVAWVAYGVGAACVATGGLLYYLGHRKRWAGEPSVSVAPAVAPGHAGAAIAGHF